MNLELEAQIFSSPEATASGYNFGLRTEKCQAIEIERAEQACWMPLTQKGTNFPLTTNQDSIRVQFKNAVVKLAYNNPTTDEATTLATTKKLLAELIGLFPQV